VPDELVRRILPGELIAADEQSLRLVDGTVFRAPPGMTLPPSRRAPRSASSTP
jgi:hypothetical protein